MTTPATQRAPAVDEEGVISTSMGDRMLIRGLRLLPQNAFSRLMGSIASIPIPPPLRSQVLGVLAKRFGIDTEEAEHPLAHYRSFRELFARRLREGARDVFTGSDALIAPCDGTLGQCGPIHGGLLTQVKGRRYSMLHLLGGDEEQAKRFSGGHFMTIYLSPRNYHRVHFPIDGQVESLLHIPGGLLPVNRAGLTQVDDLFSVNERVITFLDNVRTGPVAVVMVGATSVGKMTMAYHDTVSNNGWTASASRRREVRFQPAIPARRADELGAFNLGSTVVLLLGSSLFRPEPKAAGAEVRMGQHLGSFPQQGSPHPIDGVRY